MSYRLYARHGGAVDADLTEITDIAPAFDGDTVLIEMGMELQNGQGSTGRFVVNDPDANVDDEIYLPSHTYVRWTEDASGCELWLATGRITDKEIGRGTEVSGDHLEWHVSTEDGNAELAGLALTEDVDRPEETDIERLYWLQGYSLNGPASTRPDADSTITYRPSTLVTIADSPHLAPDSNTVTMPAKTYPIGTELSEIVNDCANTAGKTWGVEIHHGPSTGAGTLYHWDFDTGPDLRMDVETQTYIMLPTPNIQLTGTGPATACFPDNYGWLQTGHSDPIPLDAGTYTFEMDIWWEFDPSVRMPVWTWYTALGAPVGSPIPIGSGSYATGTCYHLSVTSARPAGATYGEWSWSSAAFTWADNFTISGPPQGGGGSGDCSHLCLFYKIETDHTYASAAKISDEIADWDPDNLTAPVWEPHWDQGMGTLIRGSSLASGIISRYGTGTAVNIHLDAGLGDVYEYWNTVVDDSDSVTAPQADARAQAILAYRSIDDHTDRVSVIVHPEQTGLIATGMSMDIKSAVMAGGPYLNTYVTRRIVSLSWEPRVDGMYWAHLQLNRALRRMPPSKGRLSSAATTPSDAATLPYNPATSGMAATNMQDAADELDGRVDTLEAGQPVRKNSAGSTFTRRRLNFIEGSNVTLTVADDSGDDEVDITIDSTGGGGGGGGLSHGSSFPGSPATGDAYIRDDLGGEAFEYDGTRWLSLTVYSMHWSGESVGNTLFGRVPVSGWDIWAVALELSLFATTNNGSNYWIYTLTKTDTANASTTVGSVNSSGISASTWGSAQSALGVAIVGATYPILYVASTASGGPSGAYMGIRFTYRRIAT